jgi:arylsulfatase
VAGQYRGRRRDEDAGADFQALTTHLPFQGIDVGIDRRSPVDWALRQRHGTFAFTGELSAITYVPRLPAPDAHAQRQREVQEIGLGLE